MPARKEPTVTLWEARYAQYEANYDIRREFMSLHPDTQNKYHMLAYTLPEWKLNQWGCPASTDDLDRQLCQTANQNGLDCAWFLISFYTSEAGWEEYVRQFNELPADESYPAEGFPISTALRTPVEIKDIVMNGQKNESM